MIVMCTKFSRKFFNAPGIAFGFLLCLGLVVLFQWLLFKTIMRFFKDLEIMTLFNKRRAPNNKRQIVENVG